MVSAAPALDSHPAAWDRSFAQAAPWLAGLPGYAVALLAPQVLSDGDSHYLRAERPDLATQDSLIACWGVRWTLLNPQDPLTQVMDRRPDWRRLYADRYAVIHVREEEARRAEWAR